MEVVYPRWAGLAVHKKRGVGCRIVPTDEGRWQIEVRSFGTLFDDLLALADWLRAGGVSPVAMASTGV